MQLLSATVTEILQLLSTHCNRDIATNIYCCNGDIATISYYCNRDIGPMIYYCNIGITIIIYFCNRKVDNMIMLNNLNRHDTQLSCLASNGIWDLMPCLRLWTPKHIASQNTTKNIFLEEQAYMKFVIQKLPEDMKVFISEALLILDRTPDINNRQIYNVISSLCLEGDL